jgi:hypothetical protein
MSKAEALLAGWAILVIVLLIIGLSVAKPSR